MLLSREQLVSSLELQKKLVKSFKSELCTLEQGKLIVRRRKTRVELYQSIKVNSKKTEKRIYTDVANCLRRRWCVEKSIELLESNVIGIEKTLKLYKTFDPFYINENMPKSYRTEIWSFDGMPQKEIFNLNCISASKILADSKNENTHDYLNIAKNNITLNPEGLKFDTGLGFKVRSKSEVLIAMVLHKYGVIFKYEMHIYINGKSYCPDFIIINKKGEIIIWEHFGMMDNKNYRTNAIKKIGEYLSVDLVIGKNLIITSESSKMPLDITVVKDFVERISEETY